jgi:hypothetical protein
MTSILIREIHICISRFSFFFRFGDVDPYQQEMHRYNRNNGRKKMQTDTNKER